MSRQLLGSILVAVLTLCGCSDDKPTPADAGVYDQKVPAPDLRRTETSAGDLPRLEAGKPDAGHHSFETALPIPVGSAYAWSSGELPDPPTSKDYYRFTGKQGQVIRVVTRTNAAGGDTAGYPDPVVTIFDAAKTVVAQEDDRWPPLNNNVSLYTRLPADGDYYALVEDCNSFYGAGPSCAPASSITKRTYEIAIVDVATFAAGTTPSFEGASDQDGTGANAIAITLKKATGYYTAIVGGVFQKAGDLDVFSFTLPADVKFIAGQRGRVTLWLHPQGKPGNGSTAAMKVWIVDPTDSSGKHLAELDQASYGHQPGDATNPPASLSVPITADKPHHLFVQSDNATLGARDFYLLSYTPQSDFPVSQAEQAEATNDDPKTPEVATGAALGNATAYGVDGDIKTAGVDVDHWSLAVPAGKTKIQGSCQAQREGSGLRGFKLTLLKSDGTPIAGATATEQVSAAMSLPSTAIPSGASPLLLKLEATSQDPNITSTSYRCTLLLLP